MESIEPASLLEANLRAGVTNENHLQSLGLVMDNGRPRFKVDGPVGSATGLNSLRSGIRTLQLNQNLADPEEESFVVLGKDSLCSIQASSLASYAEIQRKSISTDYNSIISSLTAEEIEKKVKELLQENVKLKETLNQNNLAMKRQFNTLAAWQEEIMKVHQTHKQKFSETKKLICQLKKENSELRIKASQELVASSDHGFKVKELEEQLHKTLLAEKAVQSAREVELEEANLKLKKELEDLKNSSQVLTSDVQRYMGLSTRLSQQLKQADWTIEGLKLDLEKLELNLKEKEQLASLADYSLLSMSSKQAQESEIWKEKSQKQNKEIEHLKEWISSLEQQLKITSQNSLPSIEIETGVNGGRPPSDDRLQFAENVKQYNEILQKLSDCYAKQGSSYIKVQECLIESIETLQDLEKMKSNQGLNQKEELDKLIDCRARLNGERLEMNNERQEWIKAQNQLEKVFSDYNSVLYELEIMHQENAKLSSIQIKSSEETLQQNSSHSSPEIIENLSQDKKPLEKSEASNSNEKFDLSEVEKVRERLQSECASLQLSLNRQKLVQEAVQKSFLAEKKNLDETVEDLQKKNLNYEQMLKSNAEQMHSLKSQVKSLKEESEKLPILQAQLQIYESDFQEERQARQNLAVEKDKIVEELVKFQKLHQNTLAGLESRQQSQSQCRQPPTRASAPNALETEDIWTTVITAFSCPKCSLSFNALRPLQEHVERCLELQ